MFFDRYLGLQGHLYIGGALKMNYYNNLTAITVNNYRIYFPELFVMAALKCKKKLWRRTANNLDDLIIDLGRRIEFDVRLAQANISELQKFLRLKAPILEEPFTSLPIDNANYDDRWIASRDFSFTYTRYDKDRKDSIRQLIYHNIHPDNLDFGNLMFINVHRNVHVKKR